MDTVNVPDPWHFDFGSDADPQIRTFDKRIRLWLLLFSSVTFETQKKNLKKVLCLLLFEDTFTPFFKDKSKKKVTKQ